MTRRTVRAAGFAAALLLTLPSAAVAQSTVTLGATPFATPFGPPDAPRFFCDGARLVREDPEAPAYAPSYVVPLTSSYGDGAPVVTSWRMQGRTDADAAAVEARLLVFRPVPGNLAADPVLIARSALQRVAPGGVAEFPADIPVQPGDQIGLASTGACTFTSAIGRETVVLYNDGPLVVGELARATEPGFSANRPNISATVTYRTTTTTTAKPKPRKVKPRKRKARARR